MSESTELLAIRKDLLVAQSSLYRLKVGRDVTRVRESLSLGNLGSAVAGSGPAREVALGLLMAGLGSGRLSRLVRLVGRVVVVARLALAAFTMAKSASAAASPAPSGPAAPPSP